MHGVSTQRPEEQAAFAEREDIPFPLLSDVDLTLAAASAAVRPHWTAARLKRLVAVVDADRVVRHAIFPVVDIPAAVEEALGVARAVSGVSPGRRRRTRRAGAAGI